MNKRIVKGFILAVIGLLVLGGPVAAYMFSAPFTITEDSGNSYDMIGVSSNYTNHTWMAANGIHNSTANDTRVETLGGSEKHWMVADNKTLCATALLANSQLNLVFTTHNSEADAMDIITGPGGYLTTADAANMELGDNFTLTYRGYVNTDTGVLEDLINKDGAFRTFASPIVSGNITSSIYNATATTANSTSRPDSAGDSSALTKTGGAANWDTQQDDNDGTYVQKPVAGNEACGWQRH